MRETRSRRRKSALKENRLERARETVAEQRERLEKEELKKRKKKRTLQIVRPVSKPAEVTILTTILTVILTLLLGLGFTSMLTTTYSFEVNYYVLFLALGLLAWGCSACHASESKTPAIALIAGMVFFAIVMFALDILDTETQAEYAYSILQQRAFRKLPAYFTKLEEKKGPITILVIILNFIPTYFTSFVVTKRKNSLLALVWYIPFLFASTVVTYIVPSAWACQLAVTGVLLLLVFQFIRKLGDRSCDERMLKLVAPFLAFTVLIGVLFPAKGYDGNKLASEKFTQIQDLMKDAAKKMGIGDPEPQEPQEDPNLKNGYKGSVLAGDDSNSAAVTNTTSENLSKVGFFNPPDVKIMEIFRTYNDKARTVSVSARHIYLRCAAMEIMEGNSWRVNTKDKERAVEDYFVDPSALNSSEGVFVLRVKPYFPMKTFFIPEYVDGYVISSQSSYANLGITEKTAWNLNETVPFRGTAEEYYYAYNVVPTQVKAEWSPEYMEEVYTTCLEVPSRTLNGILESEMLPDWYLELLHGEIEMSTAETVSAVIEYVRSLHPYSVDTPYPPEGSDFVTWFMTESRTGFCVHYATTAAVLLRMVGIPTRYVTGYMVANDTNGSSSQVSMQNAHAWIEFFDPGYGWIMDDPTPGNGLAASSFNTYAIGKEYGDMIFEYRLSPTPTPKAVATPTPVPTISEEEEESAKLTVKDVVLHPVAVGLYIAIAVILILKLLYNLFWRLRFKMGTPNSRATAYMQYFAMHMRVLDGQGSRVAESICKKAEYSEAGIRDEDLSRMLRFAKHNLEVQRQDRSIFRRILSNVLLDVRI